MGYLRIAAEYRLVVIPNNSLVTSSSLLAIFIFCDKIIILLDFCNANILYKKKLQTSQRKWASVGDSL